MKILITGGYSEPGGTGKYSCGVALICDWKDKTILDEFTYVSPDEYKPFPGHMMFTHGHLSNKSELCVPTSTEILRLDISNWKILERISHRSFNDIHHVVEQNGHYYVCNTGLQAIQKIAPNRSPTTLLGMDGCDPWTIYDRNRDYRSESTKPHSVHPNFIADADGQFWITRFHQQDAILLDDPKVRIDMPCGNPHDGVWFNERLYYTTTNGNVVVANPVAAEVERIIDLNALDNRRMLLGWCRGVCPISSSVAFVGFSAFRRSAHKEFGHWILNTGEGRLPSRIAQYDLDNSELIDEFTFGGKQKDMSIFSILAI